MNPRAKHILIVDDEPNVRMVFRTALESSQRTVAAAEGGEEALSMLSNGGTPPDLILLDLQMPGMGGMDVLDRLRGRGLDVPVVIVTAHGSIPDAVRAMKLGAIDFVSKPLTPEALRKVVDEVLRRHDPEVEASVPAPKPRVVLEPITHATQFAVNLTKAKRAINHRAFEEAGVYLKQAVALAPNSAEANNLLGVVHECLGDHDASYRAYRAALKADKRYEPANHNMTRYYERFTFGRSDVPIDTGTA